jgi:hypothetical protein
VPILAVNGKYLMYMLEAKSKKPGHVDDWKTIAAYLQQLDYLSKSGTNWTMFGKLYQTLDTCKGVLYNDPDLLASAKETIIGELLTKGSMLIGGEESNEANTDTDIGG